MLGEKYARSVLGIVIVLSAAGCVTLPPNHVKNPQDPWESWNRGVYRVNDKLDRAFAKPVAKTYVRFVPQTLRTGVSNAMSNLNTPTVMINDLLQGKFLAAANDLGRFLLNSTVGIGGLLDPASSAGLDKNDEDFGQTLGHWGVKPGPFVELPFLGPSDARDAPAKVVDSYTNPRQYIHNNWVKYGLWGVDLIDRRAGLLSLDDAVSKVFDPYAFIRDAYLQRRAYLVSDGKGTDEAPLEDPGADEPPADQPAPVGRPPDHPAPVPPPEGWDSPSDDRGRRSRHDRSSRGRSSHSPGSRLDKQSHKAHSPGSTGGRTNKGHSPRLRRALPPPGALGRYPADPPRPRCLLSRAHSPPWRPSPGLGSRRLQE